MGKQRRYVIGFLLVALLAGGCSSPRSRTSGPALIEAWKVPSITPVGQPVAAGDTVVVYGTAGKDLYLYGLAVADGAVRWTRPASPSATTSGIPLTPRVIDGLVAYLRPDSKFELAARLVVASPDTGSDRLVTQPMLVLSQPDGCFDDKDICVRTAEDGRDASRRFSVAAGGPVPDRGAPPPGSRFVGDDLLDLGRRDPEVLAGFKDGTVRWQSPLSSHFSAGYTTDRGWYFVLYDSAGLHVGSVGRPSDRDDSSAVVWDVGKVQTAAIDATTGTSAWRSDGTSYVCNHNLSIDQVEPGEDSDPWPVRCRYRGTARYDRATQLTTYEGLDVTVEGFDVRTGTTTWSVPLGPAEAFMVEDVVNTPVGESEVLVQGSSGPVVIDLANGSTRGPGKRETFWCSRKVIFEYREARHLTDGTTHNSWRGGDLLDSCGADGSPTAAVPGQLAKGLGATVGQRTMVATPHGIVAYDRRAG